MVVLPRPPRPGAMEGGPPENNLKEGWVCCHDGLVRCWGEREEEREGGERVVGGRREREGGRLE